MNNEIEEGLSTQMDIIEILKWFRVFKFVSIITLRKNQAQMVKYFAEYSLSAGSNSRIEDSIEKADLELDDLMSGFRPQDDYSDRVMLYMLTGRNLDNVMKDWVDAPPPPNAAEDSVSTPSGLDANGFSIQN